MNTWRPFANGLVPHSFESFQKKYDKISITPKQSFQTKEKFDPAQLFPFKIPTEDVEQRFHSFRELQVKVLKQRDRIKKTDLSLEARKKEREDNQKLETLGVKEKRVKMMIDVRRNNEYKTYRQSSVQSHGAIRGAFELTQMNSEKSTKMPSLRRKS